MTFEKLALNNAEERLQTLRPKHLADLENLLAQMPRWDEKAFVDGLNALGWTERRVPLHIFQAEREEWQGRYEPCPYGKVSYSPFSYEGRQELKTAFFMFCRSFGLFADKTGRFVYAGKKGMGLIWASGKNSAHVLRLFYTDFPLLYDMDKLGVGPLLVDGCPDSLKASLQKGLPQTKLPPLVMLIS